MQHPKFQVRKLLITRNDAADCWVAQAVEYDIVAQAKTREDLWKAFGHVYYGEILLCVENNEPVHFSPAPEETTVEFYKASLKSGGKVEQVSWDKFIPDWVRNSAGLLATLYGAPDKKSVELALANAA